MNREQRDKLLAARDMDGLLVAQGFDRLGAAAPIPIDVRPNAAAPEQTLQIAPIAEKRGFVVAICETQGAIALSTQQTNRLVRQFARLHHEHLLILCGKDAKGGEVQKWLVSIRPQNRPLKMVQVEWRQNGATQLLHEKLEGLVFPLQEEKNLTIVAVVNRVRHAFSDSSERVTRAFYGKYKEELDAFAHLVKGIAGIASRQQYAALMLNRLMFVWFIQKKNFLNNEPNYLPDRLAAIKSQYGPDQFHDRFYRDFLRRLFAEGLNTPAHSRTPEAAELLGRVPYLNGGLFDAHQLETDNPDIRIPDRAFERIFAFFAKYQWRLDARPGAAANEINPDILGYIFEKFINNRASMGAYYTQEDITDYIAKNTLLPHILRRAQAKCPIAFNADENSIWHNLRANPERYIYPALRHGAHLPDEQIPDHIRQGLSPDQPDLQKRRAYWNTAAAPAAKSSDFALPGETWRECIARRARCASLRTALKNGEIADIAQLTARNLDIRQFASDAIAQHGGKDFVGVVFAAIAGARPAWTEGANAKPARGISVLDPACGSGAFLFAALNILQEVYAQCIAQMQELVQEDDARLAKKGGAKRHQLFRRVLEEIADHPNQNYWIYKTIILENLYGVDIMPEAAEIAKLRLFLKLAAEAEYAPDQPNLGLEPLPDIDYNICGGNALTGFASMAHFARTVGKGFDLDPEMTAEIKKLGGEVKAYATAFRNAQTSNDGSHIQHKDALAQKLATLNGKLNAYLAKAAYGVSADLPKKFADWLDKHQPFHWLAEFYDIMENSGGFDVIIGNPPYVSKLPDYTLSGYVNNRPPDLYAAFIERTNMLLSSAGDMGMIVPLSLGFSERFAPYREILAKKYASAFFSSYGRIPSGLFSADTRTRNTICIASKGGPSIGCHTSRLHRWNASYRRNLLDALEYAQYQPQTWGYLIPKINSNKLSAAFEKIIAKKERLSDSLSPNANTEFKLQHINNAYNWIAAAESLPECLIGDDVVPHTNAGELYFTDEETRNLAMLLINGKLLFAFWCITGSDFNVSKGMIAGFPIALKKIPAKVKKDLLLVHQELVAYLPTVIQRKLNAGRKVGNYNLAKCRHITDKSDLLFSQYLGIDDAWQDIELYCDQVVRTEFAKTSP